MSIVLVASLLLFATSPSEAGKTESILLTDVAPTATITIPLVGTGRVVTKLYFLISHVVNPKMRDVAVCFSLEGADQSLKPAVQRTLIGCIALYPSDRGGEFALTLSRANIELIGRSLGPRVSVTLKSDNSTIRDGALHVEVSAVRWE
jgi:hypothetical protein